MRHVSRISCAAVAVAVVVGFAAAAATWGAAAGGRAGSAATFSRWCGWRPSARGHYRHVVWIWMENHNYTSIVGAPGSDVHANARFLNDAIAPRCGLATKYRAVTHPSLPNYIAATSGGLQGIQRNCVPGECATAVRSIFEQVTDAGRAWRSYAETMPRNCTRINAVTYAVRHNPAPYYTRIARDCLRWDVPLGTITSGNLARALDRGTLPAFTFVTPDVCSDMHDCPVATGDAWLRRWLTRLVRSAAYQRGDTAIFIVWDEGEGGGGVDCTTSTEEHCHVPAFVIAPSVPRGARSDALYTHYSLLRTAEEMLGLRGRLGLAGAANTRSLRGAFRL